MRGDIFGYNSGECEFILWEPATACDFIYVVGDSFRGLRIPTMPRLRSCKLWSLRFRFKCVVVEDDKIGTSISPL